MTHLALRNLEKTFGGEVRAVAGVDLVVQPGELLVLLGPSGGGKTTTLRMIAGLTKPTAGDVLFDGTSVLQVRPENRGVAMVFQDNALFGFRNVGENLEFGLRMRMVDKSQRRHRIADALAAVHLSGFESRWPDDLSGGQRQRVALARALVVQPRLLLLDEPLNSLEPGLRAELGETICALQRQAHITTVLVTHDHPEAFALADRVALMVDGRIRQAGTPDELMRTPADSDVERFFAAIRANAAPETRQPANGQVGGSEIHDHPRYRVP